MLGKLLGGIPLTAADHGSNGSFAWSKTIPLEEDEGGNTLSAVIFVVFNTPNGGAPINKLIFLRVMDIESLAKVPISYEGVRLLFRMWTIIVLQFISSRHAKLPSNFHVFGRNKNIKTYRVCLFVALHWIARRARRISEHFIVNISRFPSGFTNFNVSSYSLETRPRLLGVGGARVSRRVKSVVCARWRQTHGRRSSAAREESRQGSERVRQLNLPRVL